MERSRIIIITGLSGSGKSTALAALEDAGFFCVDNLPVALLPKFLELKEQNVSEVNRLAFVMDLREKTFVNEYKKVFSEIADRGYTLDILFLEADEQTLVRRYSETRRQHPLAQDQGLLEGIRAEKSQLEPVRKIAHKVINTSEFTVHQLKQVIREHADRHVRLDTMRIAVLSFGFKYGIPHDADLVFDVRFLPNPFFVPELKDKSGTDTTVRDYVIEREVTQSFLARLKDFLDFVVPLYKREGKAYLTIALGCTGGQHRSVALAEEVAAHLLATETNITITHRDIPQ